MTKPTAQAMTESASKEFCILDPSGSRLPLCRITAEWSAAAGDTVLQELQDILWDAECRIRAVLSGED